MHRILASLVLALPLLAHAENRVGHFAGGMCIGWYEAGENDWEARGYCLRYQDIAPDEKGSIADYWFKGDESVLEKQLTRELTDVERGTLADLLADKPPSLYVVKYTWFGSRPTYPLVDGKRGTKSNGRVNVGEPCSCQFRDGDYCEVSPGTVALCSRR